MVAVINASTWGSIAAADRPSASLAATSSTGLRARPQASELTVNAAIPATYIRRWPNRSPRRPPVISPAAYANA